MTARRVWGLELRQLADRAAEAGQRDLSDRLHDLARWLEAAEPGCGFVVVFPWPQP